MYKKKKEKKKKKKKNKASNVKQFQSVICNKDLLETEVVLFSLKGQFMQN